MVNFVVSIEDIKEHNLNWPQIFDHPYRILITGGSGSGKANLLFNLTSQQPDLFYRLILPLHHIILYVLEEIF